MLSSFEHASSNAEASGGAVKALDVPMTMAPPKKAPVAGWDGTEPVWIPAARAAVLWPIWSLVALLGVPGGPLAVPWLHGILALSIVLGLMVAWTHRATPAIALGRWLPSIVGMGLMGELLANALTDMGRGRGIADLNDAGRALATWLVCVAVYEVAPIVAAASRVSAREHRPRSLDVAAHGLFLAIAALAYAWRPSLHGWFVSPWMAATIAAPLAVVRCGPRRDAHLPRLARPGVVWMLALVAWAMLALCFAGDLGAIGERARATWRYGTDPLEGMLWALPALACVLSMTAAGSLLFRARGARRARMGVVHEVGDGGVTLERDGVVDPTWVAIESGPLPPKGARITLLGVRERAPDAGPFRDGAPRLSARRAWIGARDELARALAQRAAVWLVSAALGALGVWLQLALLT